MSNLPSQPLASPLDRLRGSFPPIVTPFRNGCVDYDTYRHLVAFQIEHGSHGILVNGTTAEPSSLTIEERNRLVEVAVEEVAGRMPVVAATGSQSMAESRVLSLHAANVGVDALLIVTPYYCRPPQRGLVEYYLELLRGIDLPWMIYNIPGRTAVSVEYETLDQLAKQSPNFIGIKHATNDLGLVSRALRLRDGDFRIFVGLEELSFPSLALGACGLMNAVGNLQPRVLAQLCQLAWDGHLERARALHDQLLEVNQAVFFETNPIPIKYMMCRMGLLPNNEHRLPLVPASPVTMERLDKVLERSGFVEELK